MRQLPNVLTLIRICLVVPVAWELQAEHYRNAIGLFLIAGMTDALDGFLARRFDWRSRFGAMADPLADKLLLVTTFVILALSGKVPMWLMWLALARDLWIITGTLLYRLWTGHFEIQPSLWGKLSTFFQIAYLASIIVQGAGLPLPDVWIRVLMWAVTALAGVSALDYTLRWWIRWRSGGPSRVLWMTGRMWPSHR